MVKQDFETLLIIMRKQKLGREKESGTVVPIYGKRYLELVVASI